MTKRVELFFSQAVKCVLPVADGDEAPCNSRVVGNPEINRQLLNTPSLGHNRLSGHADYFSRRATARPRTSAVEVGKVSKLTQRSRERAEMSSEPTGKHAGPGAASNQPAVPETTFADQVRTLLYLARIGSLSTLSRKQQGFPFGSVMPYALDENGRPIFLISTMAMHTQNLQADPRASLLVTQPDAGGDPLGASRVTLLGNVLPIPEGDVTEARK